MAHEQQRVQPIWRVVSGMPATTGSIGTPAAA